MKESGITTFDDYGVTRVTIQCGGKIAPMVGVGNNLTCVDFVELTDNVGAGNTIGDNAEVDIKKPSVRIVANDSKSWMSIIKTLVKAYIAQDVMEKHPDISKEDLVELLESNEYNLEITKTNERKGAI